MKTIGQLSVGGSNWHNSNFEQPIQVSALKAKIMKSENRFPLKNQTEKLNKIALESIKMKINDHQKNLNVQVYATNETKNEKTTQSARITKRSSEDKTLE